MKLTIICACNDADSLRKNLLASPIIGRCQLIRQYGYTNVPKAYNYAMQSADGDVLVFVHQDVLLPERFETDLLAALSDHRIDNWGVLGVAGRGAGGIRGWVDDRGKVFGQEEGLPAEVQTLDELLLIVKRGTFTFDENIPNHHLIGTDLCLQAIAAGKQNYAIRAFCHHNSKTVDLDPAFWVSAEYIVKKWPQYKPISNTSVVLK